MGRGVRAEGAMRGVGCARLRRAGEGAGAGERAETAERDSIADGTALRCGRVGSRHFQKPRDSSRGFFVCMQKERPLGRPFRLRSVLLVVLLAATPLELCGA